MISFPGGATNVSFHVTVMSLDTIDEGSMVRSFVRPISPCHNKPQKFSKVVFDILDTLVEEMLLFNSQDTAKFELSFPVTHSTYNRIVFY